MRPIYLIPLLVFALGSALISASTSGTAEISLLGVTMFSPVVRDLGIIVLIFSAIALLAAYGSTIPPRRQAAVPPGEKGQEPDGNRNRQRHLSPRA